MSSEHHIGLLLCALIYYHFYYINILFFLFIEGNFWEAKNLCVHLFTFMMLQIHNIQWTGQNF